MEQRYSAERHRRSKSPLRRHSPKRRPDESRRQDVSPQMHHSSRKHSVSPKCSPRHSHSSEKNRSSSKADNAIPSRRRGSSPAHSKQSESSSRHTSQKKRRSHSRSRSPRRKSLNSSLQHDSPKSPKVLKSPYNSSPKTTIKHSTSNHKQSPTKSSKEKVEITQRNSTSNHKSSPTKPLKEKVEITQRNSTSNHKSSPTKPSQEKDDYQKSSLKQPKNVSKTDKPISDIYTIPNTKQSNINDDVDYNKYLSDSSSASQNTKTSQQGSPVKKTQHVTSDKTTEEKSNRSKPIIDNKTKTPPNNLRSNGLKESKHNSEDEYFSPTAKKHNSSKTFSPDNTRTVTKDSESLHCISKEKRPLTTPKHPSKEKLLVQKNEKTSIKSEPSSMLKVLDKSALICETNRSSPVSAKKTTTNDSQLGNSISSQQKKDDLNAQKQLLLEYQQSNALLAQNINALLLLNQQVKPSTPPPAVIQSPTTPNVMFPNQNFVMQQDNLQNQYGVQNVNYIPQYNSQQILTQNYATQQAYESHLSPVVSATINTPKQSGKGLVESYMADTHGNLAALQKVLVKKAKKTEAKSKINPLEELVKISKTKTTERAKKTEAKSKINPLEELVKISKTKTTGRAKKTEARSKINPLEELVKISKTKTTERAKKTEAKNKINPLEELVKISKTKPSKAYELNKPVDYKISNPISCQSESFTKLAKFSKLQASIAPSRQLPKNKVVILQSTPSVKQSTFSKQSDYTKLNQKEDSNGSLVTNPGKVQIVTAPSSLNKSYKKNIDNSTSSHLPISLKVLASPTQVTKSLNMSSSSKSIKVTKKDHATSLKVPASISVKEEVTTSKTLSTASQFISSSVSEKAAIPSKSISTSSSLPTTSPVVSTNLVSDIYLQSSQSLFMKPRALQQPFKSSTSNLVKIAPKPSVSVAVKLPENDTKATENHNQTPVPTSTESPKMNDIMDILKKRTEEMKTSPVTSPVLVQSPKPVIKNENLAKRIKVKSDGSKLSVSEYIRRRKSGNLGSPSLGVNVRKKNDEVDLENLERVSDNIIAENPHSSIKEMILSNNSAKSSPSNQANQSADPAKKSPQNQTKMESEYSAFLESIGSSPSKTSKQDIQDTKSIDKIKEQKSQPTKIEVKSDKENEDILEVASNPNDLKSPKVLKEMPGSSPALNQTKGILVKGDKGNTNMVKSMNGTTKIDDAVKNISDNKTENTCELKTEDDQPTNVLKFKPMRKDRPSDPRRKKVENKREESRINKDIETKVETLSPSVSRNSGCKCELCGKIFAQSSSLYRHQRDKHKVHNKKELAAQKAKITKRRKKLLAAPLFGDATKSYINEMISDIKRIEPRKDKNLVSNTDPFAFPDSDQLQPVPTSRSPVKQHQKTTDFSKDSKSDVQEKSTSLAVSVFTSSVTGKRQHKATLKGKAFLEDLRLRQKKTTKKTVLRPKNRANDKKSKKTKLHEKKESSSVMMSTEKGAHESRTKTKKKKELNTSETQDEKNHQKENIPKTDATKDLPSPNQKERKGLTLPVTPVTERTFENIVKTVVTPITPTIRQKYKCKICSAEFLKEQELAKHSSIHTGRTYDCYKCPERFTTMRALTKHLVLHDEDQIGIVSSDRPHDCDKCGEKFETENQLLVHLQIHEKQEIEHACTICSVKYHSLNELYSHIAKHHPKDMKQVLHCSHCDQSFSKLGEFRVHLISDHKMNSREAAIAARNKGIIPDEYMQIKEEKLREIEAKKRSRGVLLRSGATVNYNKKKTEKTERKVGAKTSGLMKAKLVIQKSKQVQRGLKQVAQIRGNKTTQLTSSTTQVQPSKSVPKMKSKSNRQEYESVFTAISSKKSGEEAISKQSVVSKVSDNISTEKQLKSTSLPSETLEKIFHRTEILSKYERVKKGKKSHQGDMLSESNLPILENMLNVKTPQGVDDFMKLRQEEEMKKAKVQFESAERAARMLIRNQRRSTEETDSNTKSTKKRNRVSREKLPVSPTDSSKLKAHITMKDFVTADTNNDTIASSRLTDVGTKSNRKKGNKRKNVNSKGGSITRASQRKKSRFYVYEDELYAQRNVRTIFNEPLGDFISQYQFTNTYDSSDTELYRSPADIDYDKDYDYKQTYTSEILSEDTLLASLTTIKVNGIDGSIKAKMEEAKGRLVESDVKQTVQDLLNRICLNEPSNHLSVDIEYTKDNCFTPSPNLEHDYFGFISPTHSVGEIKTNYQEIKSPNSIKTSVTDVNVIVKTSTKVISSVHSTNDHEDAVPTIEKNVVENDNKANDIDFCVDEQRSSSDSNIVNDCITKICDSVALVYVEDDVVRSVVKSLCEDVVTKLSNITTNTKTLKVKENKHSPSTRKTSSRIKRKISTTTEESTPSPSEESVVSKRFKAFTTANNVYLETLRSFSSNWLDNRELLDHDLENDVRINISTVNDAYFYTHDADIELDISNQPTPVKSYVSKDFIKVIDEMDEQNTESQITDDISADASNVDLHTSKDKKLYSCNKYLNEEFSTNIDDNKSQTSSICSNEIQSSSKNNVTNVIPIDKLDKKETLQKCSLCMTKYSSISSYKKHLRMKHDIIMNYKCIHCKQIFTSLKNKENHICMKKAIQLKCNICNQRYSTQKSLHRHQLFHHSVQAVRIYKCFKCIQTFTRASYLKLHTRRVHDNSIRLKK